MSPNKRPGGPYRPLGKKAAAELRAAADKAAADLDAARYQRNQFADQLKAERDAHRLTRDQLQRLETEARQAQLAADHWRGETAKRLSQQEKARASAYDEGLADGRRDRAFADLAIGALGGALALGVIELAGYLVGWWPWH